MVHAHPADLGRLLDGHGSGPRAVAVLPRPVHARPGGGWVLSRRDRLLHALVPAGRAGSGYVRNVAGVPGSLALGAAVSSVLLRQDWFGLDGWQWVFIIEGAPAVLIGLALPLLMTDRPRDAKWLTRDERDWLEETFAAERRETVAAMGGITLGGTLRLRTVWLLALGILFTNIGGMGLVFWLATMVKEFLGKGRALRPTTGGPDLDRPRLPVRPGRRGDLGGNRRLDRRAEMVLRRGAACDWAVPGGQRNSGPAVGVGIRVALPGWVLRTLVVHPISGCCRPRAYFVGGRGVDRIHQHVGQRRRGSLRNTIMGKMEAAGLSDECVADIPGLRVRARSGVRRADPCSRPAAGAADRLATGDRESP